jgi:hypothetical protein
MKTPITLHLLVFSLVLLLSGSAYARKQNVDAIIEDMKPLNGIVVDVVDKQIIIDIGSTTGIHKNDLLTLFSKGKQLKDPRTGKVLGFVESRTGVLTVDRVEQSFSYTQPVDNLSTAKIHPGDKITRFKEITASFKGAQEKDEYLMFHLKHGLQSLAWQTDNTPGTELTFSLEDGFLKIKDRKGRLLRDYELDYQPGIADVEKGSNGIIYETKAAVPPPHATSATKELGKVRYDLKTYGYNQGGTLPFPAIMGDFLKIDESLNLSVIREHEILVYQLNDKNLRQMAALKTPFSKLLSVCWWQPGNGNLYLAVTGYDTDEEEIRSMILGYEDGKLTQIKGELPYIFNSSDTDGNGTPELLLAQGFDHDVFFDRGVRQILPAGNNSIKTSSYKQKLPLSYRVTGGTVFDSPNNKADTSAYIIANRLHIAENGHEVYSGGKEVGGSISSVRYVQNPDDMNPLFSTASIEVSPIVVDIDNDGTREILVPSSDLSAFSRIGGASAIKKTWLSVFKRTESGGYIKGKIGGEYDQFIQGIGVANDFLYLLTVNPNAMFAEAEGSSSILILPLKE